MSEWEKFVLKGGIQSDVTHKTFTRTIRSFTLCQLQLDHYLPYVLSNRDRFPLIELPVVPNAGKE